MAELRPLHPGDSAEIAALEARYHPAQLCDGAKRLQDALADADYRHSNYCVGLFEGSELVGYLLCYGLQSSLHPQRQPEADLPEQVLYIDDLLITEPHRRHFPRLFVWLSEQLQRDYPGLAVEAEGMAPMVRAWQGMDRYARRLGYSPCETCKVAEAGSVAPGTPERYLIRWQSLHTRPDLNTRQRSTIERAGKLPFRTRAGRSYEITVITDVEQWRCFNEPWRELLQRSGQVTAFQTLAFLKTWWDHFTEDFDRLMVIMIHDAGQQLVAAAPLYVHREQKRNGMVRSLGFIGSRWEADRPGFLLTDDPEGQLDAILHCVARQRGEWDKAYFYEQMPGAVTEQLVRGLQERGYLLVQQADSSCPYIDFHGSYLEFIAAKSRKFRKNLEAGKRKLENLGKLDYYSHSGAAENLRALLQHCELEKKSWKREAGVGVLANEGYLDFFQALIKALAPHGEFITRGIRVNDQPVASTFGIQFEKAFYSLHIVHDEAFSKASPGTYLESLELQECFENGLQSYDFLGGFLNNKNRWTDTRRETVQIFCYPDRLYYRLLCFWQFKLKPRLDAWKNR